MNKRLVCFALVLCMMLSMFLTSCSSNEQTEATESGNTTLTMLCLTDRQIYYTDAEFALLSEAEKKTVEDAREQYEAVEAAINKITKAKFKTQLDIFYYTPEQYYDILEQKLTDTEAMVEEMNLAQKEYKAFCRNERKNGNNKEESWYNKFIEEHPEWAKYIEDPTKVEEEIDLEEEREEVYPVVDENQVDILFVGSYEKYMEYIEKGWLSKLNDALNTNTAKKLTSFVYPTFLSAAKTDKGYFAIPNNAIVGEYTTLLVNKKLCDKYSDINQIKDLNSAMSLVKDVAKYEKDVDPVWSESYLGFTNVHFWSVTHKQVEQEVDGKKVSTTQFDVDSEKFSVLASVFNPDYTADSTTPQYYAFENILNNKNFVNQLTALKTIEFENYKGKEGSENEFAIGIIKGNGSDIEKYENDYYTVTLEYPVATEEDLFDSMFAVSKFTSNLNRAMEIITYLNTEASFRNLFQYGINEVNYNLNSEDCAVRTETNLYDMDIYKTGNMFIAYPDADRGMNYKTWEYAKAQDLEVASNPTIGFKIESDDDVDLENIDVVLQASEESWNSIQAAKNLEELSAAIKNASAQIEGGKYQKTIKQKAMVAIAESDDDKGLSVYAIYRLWCINMGYIA